jgi:MoaA/NifB/PqqE/SkfB family radical SAM enzyme
MSTLKFVTDTGDETLNKASILEFWNSKSRAKLIDDLDNGVQIPECSSCWKEEAAGKESKRLRDNKIYQNKELVKDMLPTVVDLSLGNLCNIKCRICSPWHSTPWLMEELKIRNPPNPKEYLNQPRWLSFKESFDRNNDYFWVDIIKLLPNAEKFDFAGGEPMYIEKHWDIIKMCVDKGWSKNQHVHYNTNGTIYPEKYMNLLEQFKIVDIQVSSDGVTDKFEYLRHPAKWNEVENNLNKFIEAKNKSKTDWLLSVCVSISAFNVYYFFETFEHYASKGLGMYINLVHDDRGAKILPPELKKIVIKKLMEAESTYQPEKWIEERNMICNHLNNSEYDDHKWKEFWKEIKVRDNIRNESFENTFPEFFQEMKEYL